MPDANQFYERYKASLPVRTMLYDFTKIPFGKLDNGELEGTELAIYESWLSSKAFQHDEETNGFEIPKMTIAISDKIEKDFSAEGIDHFPNAKQLDDSAKEYDIVIKHHNDNIIQFKKFKKQYKNSFDRAIFIEGISGNNSTSRL